jgi:hypothetical protein
VLENARDYGNLPSALKDTQNYVRVKPAKWITIISTW